ncbi:MAG: hypothetical protein R3A80_13135 [Bdellovibrionota bacterium]
MDWVILKIQFKQALLVIVGEGAELLSEMVLRNGKERASWRGSICSSTQCHRWWRAFFSRRKGRSIGSTNILAAKRGITSRFSPVFASTFPASTTGPSTTPKTETKTETPKTEVASKDATTKPEEHKPTPATAPSGPSAGVSGSGTGPITPTITAKIPEQQGINPAKPKAEDLAQKCFDAIEKFRKEHTEDGFCSGGRDERKCAVKDEPVVEFG